MSLPAPSALLRDPHVEVSNLRCHVGCQYWLKFCLHVITDERISHKCAPFFDLLCPLVWKGRYSVYVMQLVFVDIHQMCCFFLYSHLHLLLPVPSLHCVSLLLIPTSLYTHFILHTFTSAILMCPAQRSQYSEYNTGWMIGKSEFDFLPKRRYFCAPQPDYLWVPPSLLSSRFRFIFPWT